MNKFGENLKKFRKGQRLTQIQLAKMLGISNVSISKLEKGIQNPSYKILSNILEKFPEIDLLKMIGGEI